MLPNREGLSPVNKRNVVKSYIATVIKLAQRPGFVMSDEVLGDLDTLQEEIEKVQHALNGHSGIAELIRVTIKRPRGLYPDEVEALSEIAAIRAQYEKLEPVPVLESGLEQEVPGLGQQFGPEDELAEDSVGLAQ